MIQFTDNKDCSDLWVRLKSGDQESLSNIFKLYYNDLYLFGIKMVGQPDLVKDSIQDVFVRIWERRTTLGDVQNMKAYLLAAVRRRLLVNKDKYTQELKKEEILDNYVANFSFSVSEFNENEDITKYLKNLFHKAIQTLPERQRELIFLRFYYDLRYAEIAIIMEVNEQSIKNLMQRALSKMRETIDSQVWKEINGLDELLVVLFTLYHHRPVEFIKSL